MSISEIKDSIYIIKNIIDYDKCKQIVNFITENKTLHQYIEVNSLKKITLNVHLLILMTI